MRVSKPPHQRRAEFLAAARRLFDEKGVQNTRVSDIVADVGVAQGVFYYYYTSKEELVQEVVRQVGSETIQKAQNVLNSDALDFYGKLAAFIELYLDVVDQFLGDEETRLPRASEKGEARENLATLSAGKLTEGLKVLIEQGVQQGVVRAQYPWQSTKVVLHGLRALAEEELPARPMLYTIVEQALGLEGGKLVQHIPPKASG